MNPKTWKIFLKRLNVPSSKIIKDYAGFRTFDSVIRAKKIFGQTNFTIISQKFHNERALFICNQNNIDAIAFNAQAVFSTPRNTLREYLAKFKAVLDVFILNTQPKFLGEKNYNLLINVWKSCFHERKIMKSACPLYSSSNLKTSDWDTVDIVP